MQPNTYLIIILVIIAVEFLTTLVISFLDYSHKKSPPENPSIKKDYVKAKRYLRTNIKFGITKLMIDAIILIAVILTGILNILDLSLRALGYNPIITGILFFGVIGVVTFLIGIPFSIFNTFYIEKKYNFNKTTKKKFALYTIKGILGWSLIGAVGLFIIFTFF